MDNLYIEAGYIQTVHLEAIICRTVVNLLIQEFALTFLSILKILNDWPRIEGSVQDLCQCLDYYSLCGGWGLLAMSII